MAQVDQSQGSARDLESTDAQGESADAPRRKRGSEGPRRRTGAISEQARPEETTKGQHGKC
jgi:hypothetical protein